MIISQPTNSQIPIPATASTNDSAPPKHQQPDMWGTILTEKCGPRDVRMMDDTGTPVNWIHPDLARRLKLELEECESQRFYDFHQKRYKVKQAVWFSWIGEVDNKTYYGKFYVAPKQSGIDVILGDEFVEANGRASKVCRSQPRELPSRIFARNKRSKEEDKQIIENQEKNDRDAQEVAAETEKKKNKQNNVNVSSDSAKGKAKEKIK
ncbi:hypothetical protein HD806DRAFT_329314 [Xylariaceae sp. AK1471]|nr:hypothetical protein HD806DRAFT_329314 [Xylariaceae sp. AK1471]